VPISLFPPVNVNGFSKWNLMGAAAVKPKPKPKPQNQNPQGGGGQGCGHGHHHFLPPCGGNPTPTAQPTGNPTPTATPTITPTGPPAGFAPRAATSSGGAGAGALVVGAVVFAGPSLSVIGRLRERRRRKAMGARERPPAG